MPQSVSEPADEGHTVGPEFRGGGGLLRPLPFQLLGVWQVARGGHRRPAANAERTPRVHALAREERVLDCSDGEGLCQVRHLDLISQSTIE